jgi:Family of unknown function (DUF6288)/Beta-galactosidase jelly roll domain
MMSALVFATPFKLSAQELDLATEREEGTGGDVDEVNNEDELDPSDELCKPADTWPKGDFIIVNGSSRNPVHLGPTGLWGFPAGQNIWVKVVEPGSPAAGKILPEDVIYGANGKSFPADRNVRDSFAMAITEAETKEAGGKLNLHIRRDGKFIQVPIQLKVMGSYSSTTPWNCEKSSNIIARAEQYMQKGMRPETGLPNDGGYMFGPWNDSVLFLLAAGNPETQGLVRRYIRNTTKDLDTWKSWNQERGGGFNTYGGWGVAYIKMLYGEYYLRTGDPTVLPYLEENYFNRGPNPNKAQSGGEKTPQPEGEENSEAEKKWSPPVGPTRYGLHAGGHMVGAMGTVLANEAGVKINKDKLLFDLKYDYIKRAEYGYVHYNGYGSIPIERRQIEAPLEITPENMAKGNYSTANGKLGTAAALYSLVEGYEKAVDMCSIRCAYAFNYHGGHGGPWFNGFWTPVGAYHAGPEKLQSYMKNQQCWRELLRDHTGAIWETGNAKEKKDTLSTGFAIHWAMPRKKLRMFGAPRSLFGANAPAYMKEALAAHRNRDYASAEQLTLKLQASGTVPATDKARVDHFLDSVRTLKESVEYDLGFTEALLKKGNYTLASVELPQLEMVVSPSDPRLEAIAKAVGSAQAKAQLAAAIAQKQKNYQESLGDKGDSKEALKDGVRNDLANLITLVRDGCEYTALKHGKSVTATYPVYTAKEQSQWCLLTIEDLKNAPTGWEQPGFDDSTWKKVSLPSKSWPTEPAIFLRTSFAVTDVNVFESLRIRGKANNHINFTIYINGKVVAKVTNISEGGMVFELKPESLALMKKGKNILAISAQRVQGRGTSCSLRLEGILKKEIGQARDPFELMNDPFGQPKEDPIEKMRDPFGQVEDPFGETKELPGKKNQKRQDNQTKKKK